ncbi:uncharacterized protein H6S33_006887 [Morchella sextelata]|uniref:uncharacterized protein n=1 Tax=Morchella sextelata TaxID=1174677 RepID=UPI001D04403A|nr:uncharacterized protein H6S33_006887 [Morchella sextelata]KAH0604510.1 hypothetical protein H6S33_006887 [Morchella sextelata]
MVSVYYFGRSRDIADLRTSSKEALSLPDFKNILWIGVFGSFSRNQQTDRSDVDLVVVEHSHVVPAEYSRDANYEPWTLEELLPRVWCRPVEIVLLKEELRELVAIDSLLTSRTIYGDDQSVEILQLRRDARKYLDEGWEIFRNAEKDIEALKARISEVKDVEEFLKSQSLQKSFRDQLLQILSSLNIEPTSHPIYEGFWATILQVANEIKRIVTPTSQEDSEYWQKIWDILSTSSPKSLQSLLMRLKKFVIPTLEDIEQRIKVSEQLENEDRTAGDIMGNGGGIPEASNTEEVPAVIKTNLAAANAYEGGTLKRILKRLTARFTRQG